MVALSIIIPVYNVEEHLDRCLYTVINQLFDDYEVVCVDDGSTDSSGEILDKYAEKYGNIKVIHQENKGLSGARNTGLEHAIGEYILFADSDDYFIAFNTFNILYNFAKANNSDVIIFDFLAGDREEKKIELRDLPIINKTFGSGTFNIDTASEQIYRYIQVGVWNKLYKAELLKDIRFDEGILYEDNPFWHRVYTKAKNINYMDLPFYYYVKGRDNSITSGRGENLFDIIKAFKISQKVLIDTGYWNKLKNMITIHLLNNLSNSIKKIEPYYRERFVEEIKNIDIDINYNEYETGNYFQFEKINSRLIHFIRDKEFVEIDAAFKQNNIWK